MRRPSRSSSGLDAEFGPAEFPHGLGGADDVVHTPLQASTRWDGLGHIFDHGMAYNGRRASQVVISEGDRLTGIETVAGRIASRGAAGPRGSVAVICCWCAPAS